MTPRTPLARAAAAAATAAGLGLLLSACSAVGPPNAAVVVDGRVVPESDVRAVVDGLPPELLQGGAPPAVQDVLAFFVVEDVTREIAAEYTGVISTSQVRRELELQLEQQGSELPDVPEQVLELFATSAMIQQIQATDVAREEFTAAVEDLDVEVNPRYGQVGDGLAVLPNEYEWLRPAGGGALPES
ncbi:hypothetical protein [Aquipuribacter sp. SD81]|uniref:hypothetical protein n=1 Tax=Aquipuribacter sp. SD81 TaxID=3127703 RepID=UPI00301B1292